MGMLMKVPPEDPGCVMFVFYLLAKPVKSVNITFSEKCVLPSPSACRVRVLELSMVME